MFIMKNAEKYKKLNINDIFHNNIKSIYYIINNGTNNENT
jgi:hypothetical protein